ncbi:TetR/AcrR family transcriptional regulator [Aureibacter tunicatorum]|uniref:AcrR family transcriptional regulator n=1 Tax=Aureibacter tunicatorum TaxID=866807 RepID=A0AAE3XKS5_9BACT|nr:TetR/AcrR family transcriptional regulator [Aureibacter tunicatorum]MDR6238428.1 AcrR family transcriptional regulator [Aureibacter tunicatorum]BDD03460.1 hypothetical protein AUTU_09430 [Aureibacter tunicatorum]
MSPRTKEQNEAIKTERKKAILEAALRLFSVKGYDSSSVSEIAKEAGISKGSVYNYYESKEDILMEVMEKALEEKMDFISDRIIPVDNKEKMIKMIDLVFDSIEQKPEYWRMLTILSFQPEAKKIIERLQTEKESDIAKIYKEMSRFMSLAGISAEEIAFFNFALSGASISYISHEGESHPMIDMGFIRNIFKQKIRDIDYEGN